MAERRIKIRRDFWFLDLQGFNSCLTLPLIVQIKKLRPRAVLLKAIQLVKGRVTNRLWVSNSRSSAISITTCRFREQL